MLLAHSSVKCISNCKCGIEFGCKDPCRYRSFEISINCKSHYPNPTTTQPEQSHRNWLDCFTFLKLRAAEACALESFLVRKCIGLTQIVVNINTFCKKKYRQTLLERLANDWNIVISVCTFWIENDVKSAEDHLVRMIHLNRLVVDTSLTRLVVRRQITGQGSWLCFM